MKSRSLGFSGKYGLITSKFDTSSDGICSGGMVKKSPFGLLLAAQAGRPDQHEPLNPVAVLDRKLRRQPAAKREADQPEFVETERVEQVEIMHDVVMHVGHRRVVVGLAKARMERNDNAEFLRPGHGEIDAVPNAGAMQEYQRLAACRR